MIDGKSMFFCEQQSTRSGNMALRLSSYFGKTLDMMFGPEIYGPRKLKMAPPSFFVLIFGDKNTPELQVEPLSKHFTENAPKVVKHYALKCCASDRGPSCNKLKFIGIGLSIQ
ncbi:MAG: hypothetical protein MR358_00855 [Clostridiales bacterium]|nr:hypothetical protein [Clostridiales bacterium]